MICYISETLYDDVNPRGVHYSKRIYERHLRLFRCLYFGYEHNKPELCGICGHKRENDFRLYAEVYLLKKQTKNLRIPQLLK